MSQFQTDIQIVCLGTLGLLILYTLWLSRYRGLNSHLAVRWLLVQGTALLTIVFWQWLPLFTATSSMQDRELLLMVTVVMFAFVVFLMLDLLVRASRHSTEIKRLTQELAIQRERIDRLAPVEKSAENPGFPPSPEVRPTGKPGRATIACIWIAACVGFFLAETFIYDSDVYPKALRKFFTAAYLE